MFDTVLYQFLEARKLDRTLINQLIRLSGFSLYPLLLSLGGLMNRVKKKFVAK